MTVNVNCVQQSYDCSGPQKPNNFRWGDPVYVLTRTANRPQFFEAARKSVEIQTYPYIHHLIVTDDKPSMAYLDGLDAQVASSGRATFNPDTVCQECQYLNPHSMTCGQAPMLGDPMRQVYLECYCSTSYPMNTLVNQLLDRAAGMSNTYGEGWVIILDDDNLFTSSTAVSDIMLDARHRDQLVLFRSRLGRMTPSDEGMDKPFVTRGDIDASNYMFHTSHIDIARWDDRRCGE